MFEPLFGKEGQPVSSLFHIPTGFAHSSEHAGALRGFLTDRETVYQNCLPLCTMGKHGGTEIHMRKTTPFATMIW